MEGFCVDCGHGTKDMIASGWSICGRCRNKPVYQFTFLNDQIQSKAGREYVKRAIRRHLPKQKEATA